MGNVRRVGPDFFPLDEELALLPGSLTPHAYECMVRLGAWIPSFEQAAKLLEATLRVNVSEAMTRRRTEAAGAAYETVQRQEVERIEQELPPCPGGAEKLQVSADGAMVPLVGGEWAEVKTVAIGEIGEAVERDGEKVVRTENNSYFSRMVEAQQFNRLALGEIHRRGVESAPLVAAPADGAEWIQSLLDFHCPEAIRILDFPHAAERISGVGQEIFGQGETQTQQWLEQQLHQLKHEGPEKVLSELQGLQTEHAQVEVLADNLAYLQKREPHMQYPTYQAQGLPIGSGTVESANKVVVEARLKGAGMHWSPNNVNPMLALRNLVCNDRWQQDWPKIANQLRQDAAQRRRTLKEKRQAVKLIQTHPPPPTTDPPEPPFTQTKTTTTPPAPTRKTSPSVDKKRTPYRPAPDHPWRRSPIGRARFQPFTQNKFSKN
jgi:hypothetical protein